MTRILLMYGKHFASMYDGSMVGAGAIVFAVMGYVIANQFPDRTVGSQVRLNPKLLSAILGEDEGQVEKAIAFLCSPDANSTSKAEEGRRLVKLGEFDYRVVNGAKYRAIRDQDQRREQNRQAQYRFRDKLKQKNVPSLKEKQFEKHYDDGNEEQAESFLRDKALE